MDAVPPGTRLAAPVVMRTLAVVVLLGACVGSGGAGPAVTPKLSELPVERERRDAVLDSAGTRAGPEHRRGSTPKERKAETAAATAAAVLGWILSDNANVVLGGGTSFDESWLVDDGAPANRPGAPSEASDATPPGPADELVPWVRLKDQAGAGSADPPDAPAP